ncbi:DUF6011 domain-containing protein [Nonomuraea sp. NPDC049646]|uniref:DUF6011 domain-containing protein n=1 Tax=unclassified Nonomuraea TaxID=2593643 RepID=UPI0037A7258E
MAAATQHATPTSCLSCGRTLRSAASIARGRGRTCHARVVAAARTVDLPGYKPEALAKAADLIEQAAIVPTRRPGLYTAVSSDGTVTYLVHSCGCTCPAGVRGRRCYHRAAVEILTAAAPARRAA